MINAVERSSAEMLVFDKREFMSGSPSKKFGRLRSQLAAAPVIARVLPRNRGGKNREELQKNGTEGNVYRHFCSVRAGSLQRSFVCSTNLLVSARSLRKPPANDEDRLVLVAH